jgi:hypothetical protein
MAAPEIAVLSYHGWEIDPNRLADDVRAMRARGWMDVSLDRLQSILEGGAVPHARCFHVTIDDGADGDRECVAALRTLSCPVTLFLSLGVMSDGAKAVQRELASCADVSLQDHSLRHTRTFHYRHIVGYHSVERPLTTSADRMGLRPGDPVCTCGGELVRPQFIPAPEATEFCRAAAENAGGAPGSEEWTARITARLLASGLAWRRIGQLCIAGRYEPVRQFRRRLATYLEEGRDQLAAFSGRTPRAFAHPWWEASAEADSCLETLGYRLTFSGRGLCRRQSPYEVPRLFVDNHSRRPLDPFAIAEGSDTQRWPRLRQAGRRLVFA